MEPCDNLLAMSGGSFPYADERIAVQSEAQQALNSNSELAGIMRANNP